MYILLNLVNHYETAFVVLALLLEFLRCLLPRVKKFLRGIPLRCHSVAYNPATRHSLRGPASLVGRTLANSPAIIILERV